jgi:hypothetical protein
MLSFLRENLAVLVRKSSSVVWKAEDGVFRPFFFGTRQSPFACTLTINQRIVFLIIIFQTNEQAHLRAHAFECASGGSTCTPLAEQERLVVALRFFSFLFFKKICISFFKKNQVILNVIKYTQKLLIFIMVIKISLD